MKKVKYLPKLFTSISFLVLLIVFTLLFFSRKTELLRPAWMLQIFPEFYFHISNFCISYTLFTTAGYVWLMMGVKFRSVVILGCLIVLANFIYEIFIPIINERDIVDAWYGLAGTFIGFLFLFLTWKFGLVANPLYKEEG